MFISSSEQEKQQLIPVCPQYVLITPADTSGWPEIKKQLEDMASQKYSTQKLIKFLQNRYKSKNYSNIRLLKRIKTDYFWSGVTRFMIDCMIQDSHLIASSISVLVSEQNTILKLTKYQIFLVFCHMFMATFPQQLYNTVNDLNLGLFISVFDDEDDITSKQALQFRLNKLKSLIRYFCLFYKRSEEHPEIKDQLVIFQRCGTKRQQMQNQVLKDSIKFCKVQPQIGEFFAQQNQINAISINNARLVLEGDKIVEKPIPGLGIYGTEIDYEEKIFFSHPEMIILHLIMHEGLEDYESIIVHGMEKYSALDAVSKHCAYDFRQKFKDNSQLNQLTNLKNTTLIFVKRQVYDRDEKHYIIPDIIKLSCALKACLLIRNPKHRLTSGAFYTTISQTSKINSQQPSQIVKKKKKRIEMPWHMKFLVDWLAASYAKFQTIDFYVEVETQVCSLKILAQELKDHTVNDILSIIDSYYQFKMKDKAKISLLNFMKDFAL